LPWQDNKIEFIGQSAILLKTKANSSYGPEKFSKEGDVCSNCSSCWRVNLWVSRARKITDYCGESAFLPNFW